MKVLLTVTGSWGTGSFQVAKGVAKALLEQGHQVKIFFPDSHVVSQDLDYYYNHPDLFEIWHYPLQKNTVCLDTFPLMLPDPNPRSPNAKTFNELTKPEWELYFSSLRQCLHRLISEFQPDAIECQHIWAMDYVVSQLNFPYIAVAHNSDQLAYTFDPTMREITRRSAHNAQYIFAVSEAVKKNVVNIYDAHENKVVVIPCGYDEQVFRVKDFDRKSVLERFGLSISNDAKILCFSGKLSRTKGIDILLQANRYLQRYKNLHILVMGSGNINTLLSDEERKLCCFDNVYELGHRTSEEVAMINSIADFGIIPSRSEGFCIAGLETIACGTPIIMTDSARVGQYAVADVVQSENPKELASAILKLLDAPQNEYQQLCQQAMDSAAQFTWEAIVRKRLVYYEKLKMPNSSVT